MTPSTQQSVPCAAPGCKFSAGYDLAKWPPTPAGDEMLVHYVCAAGHGTVIRVKLKT